MNLSIKTISIFTNELAIKWSSDNQIFIKLKNLRLACPCAGCSGEKDALGNIYSSKKPLKIKEYIITFNKRKNNESKMNLKVIYHIIVAIFYNKFIKILR